MKRNVNILFLGLGSIGQRHLRNLKKLLSNKVNFYAYRRTRHVPLLDNKGNKIKGEIEKKFNISIISDLNFVDEFNIDIVFITNPSSHHINSVLRLKNLKNIYIFIEKPLDSSLKNYNQFLKHLRKNKINVFVGYNMRFHPGYIKLKNILRNGKVVMVAKTVIIFNKISFSFAVKHVKTLRLCNESCSVRITFCLSSILLLKRLCSTQ